MNYNWNWGVFFQETPEGGVYYWELIVAGLGFYKGKTAAFLRKRPS